jgi:hypothetical protein
VSSLLGGGPGAVWRDPSGALRGLTGTGSNRDQTAVSLGDWLRFLSWVSVERGNGALWDALGTFAGHMQVFYFRNYVHIW